MTDDLTFICFIQFLIFFIFFFTSPLLHAWVTFQWRWRGWKCHRNNHFLRDAVCASNGLSLVQKEKKKKKKGVKWLGKNL